jgi:radical SAM superfamily enzyme YgiQ (UPF0313 family)
MGSVHVDLRSSRSPIDSAAASRVVLIRPPKVKSRTAPNTHDGVPPLSLAYLTSSLQEAGHTVTCIDAYGEAPNQAFPIGDTHLAAHGLTAEQIAARLPADVDFIGISCMFSQEWIYYKEVIRAVHLARPGCPIIVGGEHVTADPDYVLRSCPEVVCCVLGEGEETIVELVAALRSGGDLWGVAGIAARDEDGTCRKTEPRRRIRDIDQIPWPSWDGLPIETYLDNRLGYQEINRRSMPLLASRGCPFQCTFCSNPNMWGLRWISRDPEDVVREIKHYREKYDASNFEFYDLTAIVNRKWILTFTSLLIEADMGITWSMPSGTRSEALDEEVLINLRKSGCRALVYAPESGSVQTLADVKKRVDPENMLRSIRTAVKHGHYTRAHIIFGFPDQDLRQVLESYRYVLRMMLAGLNDVLMFPFCPYPGSELYFRLVEEGKIDPTSPDYDTFLANASLTGREITSWSNHFSARGINFLCLGGMGMFYAFHFLFRPHRALSTFVNLVRRKPFTWFERMVLQTLRSFVTRRFEVRGRRPAAALTAETYQG